MTRAPDDLAQVVLRALLAGPALGLAAGLLLAGHLRRLGGVVTFALGAGLGVALALVALDLATAPARRRRPWAGAGLGLALLPLLTPLPLLGGEFALAR